MRKVAFRSVTSILPRSTVRATSIAVPASPRVTAMLTRCRLALVGPNAVQRRFRSSPSRAAASSASVSSSSAPPRIYQHEARGADQTITSAIDRHVQAEQRGDDDDGAAGALVPVG